MNTACMFVFLKVLFNLSSELFKSVILIHVHVATKNIVLQYFISTCTRWIWQIECPENPWHVVWQSLKMFTLRSYAATSRQLHVIIRLCDGDTLPNNKSNNSCSSKQHRKLNKFIKNAAISNLKATLINTSCNTCVPSNIA